MLILIIQNETKHEIRKKKIENKNEKTKINIYKLEKTKYNKLYKMKIEYLDFRNKNSFKGELK